MLIKWDKLHVIRMFLKVCNVAFIFCVSIIFQIIIHLVKYSMQYKDVITNIMYIFNIFDVGTD